MQNNLISLALYKEDASEGFSANEKLERQEELAAKSGVFS